MWPKLDRYRRIVEATSEWDSFTKVATFIPSVTRPLHVNIPKIENWISRNPATKSFSHDQFLSKERMSSLHVRCESSHNSNTICHPVRVLSIQKKDTLILPSHVRSPALEDLFHDTNTHPAITKFSCTNATPITSYVRWYENVISKFEHIMQSVQLGRIMIYLCT